MAQNVGVYRKFSVQRNESRELRDVTEVAKGDEIRWSTALSNGKIFVGISSELHSFWETFLEKYVQPYYAIVFNLKG